MGGHTSMPGFEENPVAGAQTFAMPQMLLWTRSPGYLLLWMWCLIFFSQARIDSAAASRKLMRRHQKVDDFPASVACALLPMEHAVLSVGREVARDVGIKK